MGGPNIIHDPGYLESGLSGSLAQLVICNEIVGWIRSFLAPVVIDDETVPLDLIDELRPDGQYMTTDHTLQHYREHWYPTVFDRGNHNQWVAKGGKTLGERAAEQVNKILAAHKIEPLPEETQKAIPAIVERAEVLVKQQSR